MLSDFVYFLGIVERHQRLVLIQFLQRAPVFDRIGIDNLVPDEILARVGRQAAGYCRKPD